MIMKPAELLLISRFWAKLKEPSASDYEEKTKASHYQRSVPRKLQAQETEARNGLGENSCTSTNSGIWGFLNFLKGSKT